MDKSNCQSQAEVNFITAAGVMQTNYNNLREQNHRLNKQAREMAALLKMAASGEDIALPASELLFRYAEEIRF